jgi:hypothetical protein
MSGNINPISNPITNIATDFVEEIFTQSVVNVTNRIAQQSLQQERPAATMIILVGSSSTGKSTKINKMIEQDPSLKEYGFDLYFQETIAMGIKDNFKSKYDVISRTMDSKNITNAVFGEPRIFNTEDADLQKLANNALNAIREELEEGSSKKDIFKFLPEGNSDLALEMFDAMAKDLDEGINTVADVLSHEEVETFLDRHPDLRGRIHVIHTYCPLATLSERVNKRNKEAFKANNIGEMRIGSFPIDQYAQIHRKTTPNDAVDTLTASIFKRIYRKHAALSHQKDTLLTEASHLSGLDLHHPKSYDSRVASEEYIEIGINSEVHKEFKKLHPESKNKPPDKKEIRENIAKYDLALKPKLIQHLDKEEINEETTRCLQVALDSLGFSSSRADNDIEEEIYIGPKKPEIYTERFSAT